MRQRARVPRSTDAGAGARPRGAQRSPPPGWAEYQAALKLLADMKIEWADVTILPTDDRLVPVTDKLSNAGQLARLFLPKKARVVPLCAGETDPQAAGRAADERLADLEWPLDLAWLGVGLVALEREAPVPFVAGIPSWVPMLALPVGFGLMGLRFLVAAALPPPVHAVMGEGTP